MTLGERVRRIRTELPGKVTQTEFAEMLGVSRGEIANIEGDVLKKPSGKMPLLLLICTKFNVREDWLLNEDGPMQHPEPESNLDYINHLVSESSSPFPELLKLALVAYENADPEDRPTLDRFAQSILDGRK